MFTQDGVQKVLNKNKRMTQRKSKDIYKSLLSLGLSFEKTINTCIWTNSIIPIMILVKKQM